MNSIKAYVFFTGVIIICSAFIACGVKTQECSLLLKRFDADSSIIMLVPSSLDSVTYQQYDSPEIMYYTRLISKQNAINEFKVERIKFRRPSSDWEKLTDYFVNGIKTYDLYSELELLSERTINISGMAGRSIFFSGKMKNESILINRTFFYLPDSSMVQIKMELERQQTSVKCIEEIIGSIKVIK